MDSRATSRSSAPRGPAPAPHATDRGTAPARPTTARPAPPPARTSRAPARPRSASPRGRRSGSCRSRLRPAAQPGAAGVQIARAAKSLPRSATRSARRGRRSSRRQSPRAAPGRPRRCGLERRRRIADGAQPLGHREKGANVERESGDLRRRSCRTAATGPAGAAAKSSGSRVAPVGAGQPLVGAGGSVAMQRRAARASTSRRQQATARWRARA